MNPFQKKGILESELDPGTEKKERRRTKNYKKTRTTKLV